MQKRIKISIEVNDTKSTKPIIKNDHFINTQIGQIEILDICGKNKTSIIERNVVYK